MKQRLRWLVLLVVVASITITAIVYSRQPQPANPVAQTPTPPQTVKPVIENKTPDQPAVKQQQCFLNRSQAPDIDGLKLGLTLDEVLALFPGSRDHAEVKMDLGRPASEFGETSLVVKPAMFVPETKFVGIRQISINLLDGRVGSFNAGYDGPKYKDVDEFVAKFSAGRKLPGPADWEAQKGLDTQLKTLRCDGFEISVFAGGKDGKLNSVRMKDLSAQVKLEDRRMKSLEKKSAKP